MIALLITFCVFYCIVIGFCIVGDNLFWSGIVHEAREEARQERGANQEGNGTWYHWYRESVLRRGLPFRVACIWMVVYCFAASFVSPHAGGVVGAALFLAYVFYFFLNCFFDVDGWLLDKEIEWDYRD